MDNLDREMTQQEFEKYLEKIVKKILWMDRLYYAAAAMIGIALLIVLLSLTGCASTTVSNHTQRSVAKHAMDTGSYMLFWARH